MASDSREEQAVTVELPAELDEWLDDRAAALDVDREDVIVQLLASYHAASSLDGDLDAAEVLGEDPADFLDVDTAIADAFDDHGEDLVGDAVAAAVERELADRLTGEIEAAVEEHLPTISDAVEGRLDDRVDERMDELDEQFQAKIVDVRERVIQVKKEADGKAPADHDHDAFERIDDLDDELDHLETSFDQLESTVETVAEELREEVGDATEGYESIDERLADAEDKLKRVAWVVSDLKDEAGGRSAHEQAVARIKRAAAQEGVTQADCERCGESVEVALLTDPECPHCNATVSDVRPTDGIFRKKAKLVAAAQLEAGEEE